VLFFEYLTYDMEWSHDLGFLGSLRRVKRRMATVVDLGMANSVLAT